MFESIINFFKNIGKKDQETVKSKDAAKERLHLVLMQDRANVSADFLDLMKQEIIEVIKKYIDVDENAIDVRLTNKANSDGTTGAPALYANIPIVSIKEEVKSKIARENDDKAEHIIPNNKEEAIKKEEDNIVNEESSNSTNEKNNEEINDIEEKNNIENNIEKENDETINKEETIQNANEILDKENKSNEKKGETSEK